MGLLFRFATSASLNVYEQISKIRQGMPMITNDDAIMQRFSPNWTMSANQSNEAACSPDRKKACAVFGISNVADRFAFFDPQNMGATFTTPSAVTGSIMNSCALSNEFAAIGANNGLHIYRFEEDSVTGVIAYVSGIDTTGIGNVRSVGFSPDQRYLYVAHTTAPFLRRYDTTDWSYIDAGVSYVNNCSGILALQSGHVVLVGPSNPYVAVYSADLQARHFTTTSSSYHREVEGVNYLMQDVYNPYACYIGGTPSSTFSGRVKAAKLTVNPASEAVTLDSIAQDVLGTDDSGPMLWLWHFYNVLDDAYVFSFLGPTTGSNIAERRIRVVRASTFEVDESLSARYTREIGFTQAGREFGMYVPPTHYYRIAGTVRDIDNLPAERLIRAYRRSDGELMATTRSDPSTGNYELRFIDNTEFDVQFCTLDGEQLNDLFYARAVPERVDL